VKIHLASLLQIKLKQQQQALFWALLLYSFLAITVLSPLWSSFLVASPAADLANHLSGIIEARNALAEGQFPIRVAPQQHSGSRYPLFQFYGNLPYTVGGLLYFFFQLNPYTVWKLIVGGVLLLGATFVFKSAFITTRQAMPALLAGAVYLTAPYVATDIHGRFAFPETVSLGLLPPVFYYAYRSYLSPTKWVWYIPLSALFWLFLLMSHPATYLYGSIFMGLFFLSMSSFTKKSLIRLLRCGVGFGLAIILGAWYLVPQLVLLPSLVLSGLTANVIATSYLTTLGVLLAPTLVLPDPVGFFDNPKFGLQIGWPILLAFAGSIYYRFKSPHSLPLHPALTHWQFFFLLSFCMVWSPVDFWHYLPFLFHNIQFTYRLLIFVIFFGALLAAFTAKQYFRGKMTGGALLVSIFLLGLFISPYLTPHPISKNTTVAQEIRQPNVGRGGATRVYLTNNNTLFSDSILWRDYPLPPVETINYGQNFAQWGYGLVQIHRSGYRWLPPTVTTTLPAPRQGDTILIAGAVPDGVYGRVPTMTLKINHTFIFSSPLVERGNFNLAAPVLTPIEGNLAQIEIFIDQYFTPEDQDPNAPNVSRQSVLLNRFEYENKYYKNFANGEYGLVYPDGWLPPEAYLTLPPLQKGDVVALVGIVPTHYQQPLTLSISVDDAPVLKKTLPPGLFQLQIPVTVNYPSLVGKLLKVGFIADQSFTLPGSTADVSRPASLLLSKLLLLQEPLQEVIVPVQETRPQTKFGQVTVTTITTTQNSLVEIPVLYYPTVLRVYLDGVPAAYFSSGQFVALPVPAGQHHIEVEFVGITWANWISLLGIVLIGSVCLISLYQKLNRLVLKLPASPEISEV
jgi:hypothetical protein